MLTLKSLNPDPHLTTFLAVNFAERSLPIWEGEYPEDKRPHKAIEAARAFLKDPSKEKAADAADAAAEAADAAYAAWNAAAYAAKSAAYALLISEKDFIHEVISQNLDYILKYKIKRGQGFSEPDLIFEYLNEEGRNLFLFNLDILR